MGAIKQFIKSNTVLFSTLKSGLLYARFIKSLFEKDNYKDLQRMTKDDIIVIKENGYHCYFGYYDKSPINESGEYAAFLRIKDGSKAKDVADVCIMNLASKEVKIIGHTTTWNWQQGCMMQWIDENTISYNCFDEPTNLYITKWVDINGSEPERQFCRSAYSYNSDHTRFVSLNFYRLDLYAKGYGYPYPVDDMSTEKDGVWENNLQNNTSQLLLSLKNVIDFNAKDYYNCQHYINHVAYTPDDDAIIFIHRWQVKGGEFVSRLLHYDLKTKKLKTLLDNGHVSHYCWKDNNTLLIFATDPNNRKGYMELSLTDDSTNMIEGLPTEDGHPSYSNNLHWILTDTYPSWKRYQYLFLFDTTTKELKVLDKLWSPFRYFNDERCDLHPRWSMDNQYICADNTQSGFRSLKIYKVST